MGSWAISLQTLWHGGLARLDADIPSAGKYAGALVCAKVLHPHVEVKVAKEEIKALQQARMLGTHKVRAACLRTQRPNVSSAGAGGAPAGVQGTPAA